VEVAIYINRHVFVWLIPGQNVSAGRNAPSGKSFGWQIFKQHLHFRVKIQVFEASQGLILAGCIRRAETFLRGFQRAKE
jgi:hypothetical protein